MKVGSVRRPKAVACSSSSSESEPLSYGDGPGRVAAETICSLLLVMTPSSSLSLSLSSYSSWLLVLACLASRMLREVVAFCCWRRRRWEIRSPVVTTSSPTEDREEEDGWEEISTQDSKGGCK